MNQIYLIKKADLDPFLNALSVSYDVYVPTKKGEQRFFKKYPLSVSDVVIGEVRPFEPLKAFFSSAREVVAEDFKSGVPAPERKPYAIVGVKACDLKGFKVQDFVFRDQGVADPFYVKQRENNLVISADCTCVIETCYCLALDVQPNPQNDFDLNFSEIGEGFVVTVGSPKGEALVKKHSTLFAAPSSGQLREMEKQRQRVIGEVEENLKRTGVPHQNELLGAIERQFEGKLWEDEAKTCVECGACNIICPTCHCFLLYDQKDQAKMERFRIWDSCMVKDFARVAGGANPRKRLWMRLRNRFEKKFDFFPKVANVYACTGCGRCISACPAKIDIRKVLKRLVHDPLPQAAGVL